MTPSGVRSILPPLQPDEAAHCRAVAAHIRDEITAAGGWMSFERYMELALYAPGLGYYSAGSAKMGASGDFVTAPEVSSLFSQCVARQCADILGRTGGEILEVGAGTGRMAADVLETLQALDVLPERYAILEVSADLADRQRRRLDRLPQRLKSRVAWLDRLPAEPLRGVLLANEVLDALPCRRFRISGSDIRELGVSLQGEGFVLRDAEPDPALAAGYTQLRAELATALPDGYRSEICLRVHPWIAALRSALQEGVMLLFDYGLPRAQFYHPQRLEGTLRCHFKQRAHDDALINTGVQDITAWVDYTRVAEAALAAGLDVLGFATQAAFLLGCGIEELVARSEGVDRVRLAGEARRLLLPGEMGEAFKVMALGCHYEEPLRAFAHQDLRHSL
ncbi:MAG TPA: SAM-dependent methyltransferase [Steroidobacteraceae bacterium]|nr:SAM-dependent methyltransferase [Steroidobacteraceae bacterium]